MLFVKILKTGFRVMLLSGLVLFSRCTKEEPKPKPEGNKELLLQLVNSYRASGCDCGTAGYFAPTTPVVWNNALERAAYDHCVDMFTNKFFSHTGSDGANVVTRLKRRGYDYKTYGENIARGYPTEKSVIEGWIKSPGHCRNIMNPNFKEIGASKVSDYWTLVLGTRKSN